MTCLALRLGFPNTVEQFGAFVRDNTGTLMVVEFFSARDQRVGRALPDTVGPPGDNPVTSWTSLV